MLFTNQSFSFFFRELLSELKDGTRIISTKPYGTPNRSITDRQLNGMLYIIAVQGKIVLTGMLNI